METMKVKKEKGNKERTVIMKKEKDRFTVLIYGKNQPHAVMSRLFFPSWFKVKVWLGKHKEEKLLVVDRVLRATVFKQRWA